MENKEKPTEMHRKELLSKLESIIEILNNKIEAGSSIPILRESVDLPTLTRDESQDQTTEQVSSHSVGQQSLFEESTVQKNFSKTEKTILAKMENPFLPRHIRARLHNENQDLQSLENPASEDKRDVDLSKDLHDSIIDNLIAFYLPKIEADLRRRLKALAAEETDNKTR